MDKWMDGSTLHAFIIDLLVRFCRLQSLTNTHTRHQSCYLASRPHDQSALSKKKEKEETTNRRIKQFFPHTERYFRLGNIRVLSNPVERKVKQKQLAGDFRYSSYRISYRLK